MRRPSIKPLAERNRVAVGIVGTLILAGLVTAAFSYDRLPFIKRTSDYSAYFAEAGGIKPGSQVRVSGVNVGQVSGAHLEGVVLSQTGITFQTKASFTGRAYAQTMVALDQNAVTAP